MKSARSFFIGSVVVCIILVIALMWSSERPDNTIEGDTLIMFCASGIKPPVVDVVNQYEDEFGVSIQLSYGGSGQLLSNLRVKTSADLYLAGDDSYIEKAREYGLVKESIPLAHMYPVLAVQKGNPKNIKTLDDLLKEDITISLASPDAAAVGKITKELLQKEGIWKVVEKKTNVFKTTVNEIANDIKLKAVDVGIIWDAIGNQYDEVDIIQVPLFKEGRQEVAIGIVKNTAKPSQALHFARYLGARDKGLPVFEQHGYQPVDGDVWENVPEVVLFSGGVNRMAIDDTINRFEKREGVRVKRIYNGCGILVSQMKGGARPDAYFACDVSFIHQVSDMFLDRLDVSETDMVILVQKGNPKEIQSLQDLTKPGLKLGVANAEQSALGALTKRLLEEANIYDAVMKNVGPQTPTADMLVNQIRTGSLDAVVVYEANTSQVREHLDIVRIDHPAAMAIQPYAVGKNSDHKYLMQRLLDTITSEQSQIQFKEVGFRWLGKKPNTN